MGKIWSTRKKEKVTSVGGGSDHAIFVHHILIPPPWLLDYAGARSMHTPDHREKGRGRTGGRLPDDRL